MAEISFVWAQDEAGWIGKDNALPWHLPADLKHFKAVTMGKPIVMGYNTYLSIGRPLPHRENIVITHRDLKLPGVTVLHSIDELQQVLEDRLVDQAVAIIGGAGLFQQTLFLVNVLERTVIAGDFQGDKKMPLINYDQWTLTKRESVISNDPKIPSCHFEHWEKA